MAGNARRARARLDAVARGAAGRAGAARAAAPARGMTPVRVLVVMPLGTARGGGELMLRQLLTHGRGQGVEWTVVFLRDGPMVAEVRALGHDVQLIEAGRFRHLVARVRAIVRIARLARTSRAQLVLGWMVAGQLTAGAAAFLARIPCVWFQVGTPRPDWLDRVATALPARGVLVLSRAAGAAQARVRPRRRQWLVYPGASLDAFDPARLPEPAVMRARLGLPARGPMIGMVGRLQRWKGMHVFVAAMARVYAARPDAHAVIVGAPHETEPDYPAELHLQVSALGLDGAVSFAGFQGNVPEWMQAMDVIVHASDHEPFGIVVIEAMALGKPVVAGAAGGPAEIIADGENGLLVPYGDGESLARAILRYLDDRALAARIGAAARTRAAVFDDRTYAANVIAALRESVS
jgi:glycosyltransferase involved in cell wall biosynthesis